MPTVCLRVPNHSAFLTVLAGLGTGLAAPSANPYKGLSPTSVDHVIAGLGDSIDAVVDGGPCEKGVESTILDLTEDTPRILRPGPITKEMIEEVLGYKIDAPESHEAHVPGNVTEHYQPKTPAMLMSLESIKMYLVNPCNAGKKIVIVHYSELDLVGANVKLLPMLLEKESYERNLYAMLHFADALAMDEIVIERPPEGPDWVAVLDRLRRATAATGSRRKESVAY